MVTSFSLVRVLRNRPARPILFICLLALWFPNASAVKAQQPEDVITTNTSLVQLNVGVVDRQGHAITTLSQTDFTVYEDGVRRPIQHFESTEAPFSLVILLDMSGSTATFRQQIQTAALRFIEALAPEDRIAVVEFNGKGVKSLKELGHEEKRRKAIVVLTDGIDTEARNGDRAVISKVSGSDLETAIKPEINAQLSSVLTNADRLGVSVFP